jgi:HSP20 family protein
MHGNPLDIYDEMDEMFARLFARMDQEFMDGFPRADGFHILIRDGGEYLEMPEMTDDDAPSFPVTVEPEVEIHRIGNEVKAIADLPGITEDALRLDMKGNTFVIDAGDGDHHFHTAVELPPVDSASMQKTLKNGVLEVTFTRLLDPSEKD